MHCTYAFPPTLLSIIHDGHDFSDEAITVASSLSVARTEKLDAFRSIF